MNNAFILRDPIQSRGVKITKFLVKINRSGARTPQYLRSIGKATFATTSDRKQALLMGKFTAEDAIESLRNSRCTPELVPILVPA